MSTLQIGAFAPEAPFLPSLARLWLAADVAAQDGLIILPSRRAAQGLAGRVSRSQWRPGFAAAAHYRLGEYR